ncbi:MAG: MaoC family dehydratase [Burkholderiaceae bacterium]
MGVEKFHPRKLNSHIGCELGVSQWIDVDQKRINAFADCTGDQQWIHVDVERARRELSDGITVAHGHLTLSLLAVTSLEILSAQVEFKQAINYGLNRVRFPSFVHSGVRVRNHILLTCVEEKSDACWMLTVENSLEIEKKSQPGVVATALIMLVA